MPDAASPMLLHAQRVITGPAGEVIDDGAVLIDGDLITAVGPYPQIRARASPAIPIRHVPVLAPGLINSHVHLGFDASVDPIAHLRTDDDDRIYEGMAVRAAQLLAAGVTTARDLGGPSRLSVTLRDAIACGERPGPRLLVATTPLTSPGGHCWFLGGEVSDDASIRYLIQAIAEAGADVIKVMGSGGRMTPGGPRIWESQFTRRQLELIVHEARDLHLPVAVHGHGADSITDAVAAGVDTIEHCGWRVEGGHFDFRDDVAEAMAAQGIAACPTPTPNWRRMSDKIGPEQADRYHHRIQWMSNHGIPLILGSDAGTRSSIFTDFVSSLQALSHVGFSNAEILETVTTKTAATLGLQTGRLTPGFTADVLALTADPLADLEALRKPIFVLARARNTVDGKPTLPA